jgi:probable DNA metabolism protein
MRILCDATPDGCLCAVDWALQHPQVTSISMTEDRPQADLFAEQDTIIPASPEQADACFRNLLSVGGRQAASNIMRALLVMPAGLANAVWQYAILLHKHRENTDRLHTNPDVAFIHRCTRKVSLETHRFKGLLRFQKLKDGRFIAVYEPDYDITLFLAWHFARRLKAQPWIIFDTKRQCAATWDGKKLNAETTDNAILTDSSLQHLLQSCEPDPSEAEVQQLWRTFHSAIAIENRINPELQRRCMPARYWKHLTEMGTSAR